MYVKIAISYREGKIFVRVILLYVKLCLDGHQYIGIGYLCSAKVLETPLTDRSLSTC